MQKPNYQFEKRRRDQEKKAKKEEKRLKKLEAAKSGEPIESAADGDAEATTVQA